MTLADDYLSTGAFLVILAAFAVGAVVLAIVHAEQRRREATQRRAEDEARSRCERTGHSWLRYANYRFCTNYPCPAREFAPFKTEEAS